jgi:hypothetical protein
LVDKNFVNVSASRLNMGLDALVEPIGLVHGAPQDTSRGSDYRYKEPRRTSCAKVDGHRVWAGIFDD